MNFQEAYEAFSDAKRTMDSVDVIAAKMGRMLVGRLQQCDASTLRQLKRQLQDFNIQTGRWMR